MKANRLLVFMLVLMVSSFVTSVSFSEGSEINSADLIKDVMSALPKCLHYKIVGRCFWLECDGYYCHINSTWKLDHYLPDAVVTVYRQKGTNPWLYANTILDPTAYIAGQKIIQAKYGVDMGGGNVSVNSLRDIDNHFKEVDVIGNPAAAVLKSGSLFLPVQTAPYMPYFSSMLDAYTWRSGFLEMLYPASLIPGMHEVGKFPFNDWGNVFPRTGFLDQPSDAKNAAVIAQRAADIVTKSDQPHIYQELSHSCGEQCVIKDTKENNADTQFQMIYPSVENKCVVFGKNDTASPNPWHGQDAAKGNGNYAWLMWRHYHGCVQGVGKYLYSVDW